MVRTSPVLVGDNTPSRENKVMTEKKEDKYWVDSKQLGALKDEVSKLERKLLYLESDLKLIEMSKKFRKKCVYGALIAALFVTFVTSTIISILVLTDSDLRFRLGERIGSIVTTILN